MQVFARYDSEEVMINVLSTERPQLWERHAQKNLWRDSTCQRTGHASNISYNCMHRLGGEIGTDRLQESERRLKYSNEMDFK